MKFGCPVCYRQNPQRPVFVNELSRFIDNDGFVIAQTLCPMCGFSANIKVVQESPPCRKCGHVERTYVRGNPNIVPAPTESTGGAEDILNTLRGTSAENL